jgi:hypothetical protein
MCSSQKKTRLFEFYVLHCVSQHGVALDRKQVRGERVGRFLTPGLRSKERVLSLSPETRIDENGPEVYKNLTLPAFSCDLGRPNRRIRKTDWIAAKRGVGPPSTGKFSQKGHEAGQKWAWKRGFF